MNIQYLKRKLFIGLSSMLIFVVLLAACGSAENSSSGENAPSSENDITSGNSVTQDSNAPNNNETGNNDGQNNAQINEPAPEPEPVELVFYHTGADWNDEGYFMREYGQDIQEQLPHITPTFLPTTAGSLNDLVVSNTQLDIIVGSVANGFSTILPTNIQSDLEPLIDQFDFDVNRFEPGSIEIAKQMGSGKIVGLPLYNAPAPIYYNMDIFDTFGVEYPWDGITWDELYELAQRLTREHEGVQYYGLAASANHYMLRNQLSAQLVDAETYEVTFNSDTVRSLIDNLKRFYEVPGYDADSYLVNVSVQRGLFTNDRTAAMWLPVSTMHTEEQLAGINWDLGTFPVWEEEPDLGPQPYPYYMYITATSEHREPAFQVMDFLLSDEFQMKKSRQALFVSMLTNEDVQASFGQDAPMYEGKNIRAMMHEKLAPPPVMSKYHSVANGRLGMLMMGELLGGKDINTALREAVEFVEAAIQEDLQ